jgi:hypothetical protein
VTTYSTTRSQLQQALATVLDFSAPVRGQYGSFSDLTDAILAHLVAHTASVPERPMSRCQENRAGLTEATRLAAVAAGEKLGEIWSDAWGRACGAVEAPQETPAHEACSPAVADQIATLMRKYTRPA